MNSDIIISTYGNNKNGMGHVKRCIWLAKLFKKDFGVSVYLLVNKNEQMEDLIKREKIPFTALLNDADEERFLLENPCKVLIVDKRDTNQAIYRQLNSITIALDNFGPDKDYFDYLINPLPYFKDSMSNFQGERFLLFPEEIWNYQKPKILRPIRKILVTFGGSDPRDLSYIIKEVFERIKETFEIAIILGPLYEGRLKGQELIPEHIKIIEPQQNLHRYMQAFDLVITSFGITAFEAAIIGTPSFILNPSDYHEKITRASGLFSAGVGSIKKIEKIKDRLEAFIREPQFPVLDLPSKGNIQFKMILKKILQRPKRKCAICGQSDSLVVGRDGYFNHYFCEKDKVFFRDKNYVAAVSYSSNYFLDDYKKQYGKTYEEDRPNIDKLNNQRLKIIRRLLPVAHRKRNLLEVGSALGFFLKMAQDKGDFAVEGAEISSYAAGYAREKLRLDVKTQNFLKMDIGHPCYDVLAMWYYIEHNERIEDVLSQIKRALKIGGLLALSTPNAHGVSSRKNRKKYAAKIPADHYYEFSPVGITRLMEQNGFKLRFVRTTGNHPKRWIKLPFRFLDSLLVLIMRKKKLGDTFEAYFERIS
ncbi:MAG: hypothetical protein CVV50_00690 [Spirochaetae bacterium HGW-Spirochaetae-6]|nr:MAG: hypothetical protein CVV50_00690 [Spirochaetae bacterium HGW-Spirochaetae-6]